VVALPAESIKRPALATKHFLGLGALAALFAVAVAVRLVGSSLFITPDEDNWMRRTGNFSYGLEIGDLWRTYQAGHPGVTTMWIARLGIGPEAARLTGNTIVDGPVTLLPGFMDLLVEARRAMILVNSALMVTCVALGWRMLGLGPALVGGLLLALEPFMIAHSQVVHVDALSAGFIAVAVLAGGVFWWMGGGLGYLALCGVASGLAVLTKAPSVIVGLLIPIVALTAPLVDRERWSWWRVAWTLPVAGVIGVLTVVVLWPAMWVAPVRTVQEAITFTIATSSEHRPGNFFLGQAVADPGPLFYPVAIVFRLAPLTLAGLVVLVIFLPPRSLRVPTLLLVLFVFSFILLLTVPSKKLDRYALPVFPALCLLAGLGLWTVGAWIVPAAARARPLLGRLSVAGLAGLLLMGQAMPLISVSPYPLAYYNPIMGGAPAATRVLLVGWGEGLDQVATYLNSQPEAARQRIAVYFPLVLNFQGMVDGTVSQIGDPVPVDYVVDYVNAAQRDQTPHEVVGLAPSYVVRINGIIYARVFRLTPPRPVF
jgi:4-amino-4-deoxy-L-arabinose transferase-like glycosyltransferase